MPTVSKVSLINGIVKAYFVFALVFSFAHLVEAGHKAGLQGEAWAVPFMVDGLALVGIVMRTASFARSTRTLGLRIQIVMAAISLALNEYSAHNVGSAVFAAGTVTLYIGAEVVSGHVHPVAVDHAQDKADRAAAIVAKGKATRERKARTAKAEAKVLEGMLAR
jgi:hypothetical protein